MNTFEHFFQCPYCFEQVSAILDPSASNQEYIEDCEVCCRPIEFKIVFVGAELVNAEVKRMDDT